MSEPLKLVLPTEPSAQTISDQKSIEKDIPAESSLEFDQLPEDEKSMVRDFISQIDITDSTILVQYGAPAQTKIANFSDSMLNQMKTKDAGEAGELLSELVVEIQGFDGEVSEKKGFFQSMKKYMAKMTAKYNKVSANVDKIAETLEQHKRQMIKDVAMLDSLYETNKEYLKEISLYIIAGKEKIREIDEKVLPELQAKAEISKDQVDLQALQDVRDFRTRFEKKLNDLMLTRMISIQMAPQIRMLQSSDTQLADKIQSSLMNSIPLWKNQIVISMGLSNTRAALGAQQKVTNMTNDLLKKNSEMLKQNSIEIARENERSIVDIETLKATNANLISTINEVLHIQDEGAAKRAAAEQELQKIETELKDAMLNAATRREG